jgi:hypothetical protein
VRGNAVEGILPYRDWLLGPAHPRFSPSDVPNVLARSGYFSNFSRYLA